MQLRISSAQSCCRYPRPRRNFLLTSPFFRETRTLQQSSVRARAGHRPCSVKPRQVHEGNLSKRLAARASSKRLRQQKIPPWANPSASCTLLFRHRTGAPTHDLFRVTDVSIYTRDIDQALRVIRYSIHDVTYIYNVVEF